MDNNKLNQKKDVNRGLFIALEGPDGSGKSTIAKKLNTYIQNKGHMCILTREPGGTAISEKIRDILLDIDNIDMADRTEALLYAASRAEHVENFIKPFLDCDYTVISDRFVYSSLAYQGHGRGLGIDKIMEINKFAMNDVYPDLTIFFDISPEEALQRKFLAREGDRLENEGNAFHAETYIGYKKSIDKYSDNVRIIDANGSIENNLKQCIEIIDEYI